MDCKELSEIIECSVCLERLDHTCKVLPCQHTFCKRCLEEIQSMRKELRCPECRILVEEEIDNLPTNIILVRILEGLSKRNPNFSEKPSTSKQKIPKEPCAKVLFDYEPKELGDLALAKGDIVILLRQVDDNWYEGQIKGSQGFLPANYVDVINPLPCLDDSYNDPVAKALYDFDEVQEEDVLSFKQGDIISVTRRIDENWCEGKIDNKCGIFPVNFVVLNTVAKAIIDSLDSSNSSVDDPLPSPSSNQSLRPAAARPNEGPKRHTIHSLEDRNETNLSRIPSRHSVEISSSERIVETYGESTESASRQVVANQVSTNPFRSGGDLMDFSEQNTTNGCTAQASVSLPQTNAPQQESQARPNSAEIGKELYTALYNYRPAKEDELELKIGESYCVTEKCKDGWFKGFCLVTQNHGVFPGNYVRLASIHNMLKNSRSSSTSQVPLPSPRHNSRPLTSTATPRPRYSRSESAPDVHHRRISSDGLVVDLDHNTTQQQRRPHSSEVQNNGLVRPLLPPPPDPKSQGGFWKKLKPKKKERSRPPPPPPYTWDVPSGHSKMNIPNNRPIPATPPPPYSSQTARQVNNASQAQRARLQRQQTVPVWERFRAIIPYPPQSDAELELRVGDIIFVSKKRQDGWYKGTLERNGKTGLFPGCFSEKF